MDGFIRTPILSLASSKVPINQMQYFFKALKDTQKSIIRLWPKSALCAIFVSDIVRTAFIKSNNNFWLNQRCIIWGSSWIPSLKKGQSGWWIYKYQRDKEVSVLCCKVWWTPQTREDVSVTLKGRYCFQGCRGTGRSFQIKKKKKERNQSRAEK